ncbi:MAG: hypothetical protein GW942_01515 [Candidatus Pacebacteria bacterium]|nr:hypothetical protein [Candidatus Paceibacterota bacterium]
MKIINVFKITLLALITSFIILIPNPVKAQIENSSNGEEITDDALGGAVTDADFDALNPLKPGPNRAGGDQKLSTPGGIITKLLQFAFPIAGMILFVMLVWGGFEMLSGASTSKSMEAGKNRITSAIIGFFLLFSSFWIIQLLEVIFGISILL